VIPFLTLAILIPIYQILVVGGLHFPMLRVLVLFGFARLLRAKVAGNEKIFSGGINGIDWAFLVLTVFTAVDGSLLWQAGGAVVNQAGTLYTAIGVYFLLRYVIQDEEDVKQALRALTFVVMILCASMTFEHLTGRNLFYEWLGGARAASYSTAIDRGGFLRARGSFAHPIIAGTFGGFVFPLFLGWWKREKRDRKYATLGAVGALIIPFDVGSSTALFGLLAGVGALCLWPMRRQLRILRWGAAAFVIAGQLYSKTGVWHLIDDVKLTDASSSYHRYQLVNQCILHFWNWALIGTKDYASWGWDMWDLSNQYVGTAETAGLIPLIAFIAILVVGYNYIGKTRRHYAGDKKQEFFIWAIGASLFANTISFLGTGYWDQIIVPWYTVLAIISAMTLVSRISQPELEMEASAGPLHGINHYAATTAAPSRMAKPMGRKTHEQAARPSWQTALKGKHQ
ncbi:MAG: hypothetical protein ACRD51_18875, partial [Candidatus Acidiferrum sp.]